MLKLTNFWYAGDCCSSLCSKKLSSILYCFYVIWAIFQHFLGICDVTDDPSKWEFYKSDPIIRFLLLVSLPIQYLEHLFHFDIFWGILHPFFWVCHITNGANKSKSHTKSKVIIVQKVCKTRVVTKNYPKIAQIFQKKMQKMAPKYLILFENGRNWFVLYKSIIRNSKAPISMGFGIISIEYLVIVLHGLLFVFFLSVHARRYFTNFESQ